MKKQRAYVLIGLPGAGKSRWTEERLKKHNPRGIGVVSRDAIRYMINGTYKYIEEQKELITKIAMVSAKEVLNRGHDLVIDQANVTQATRKEVTNFLRNIEEDIEIHFIRLYLDDIPVLVKRRMQGNPRGEEEAYHRAVIEKMSDRYEKLEYSEDYDFLDFVDSNGIVTNTYKSDGNNKKKVDEIPIEELWNLNDTLAKYIYPRIKSFKEYHCGRPGGMGEKQVGHRYGGSKGPRYNKKLPDEKWEQILDKMVLAFELYLSSDDWDCSPCDKEWEKRHSLITEGFSLFMKYFGALWW